MMNAGAKHFGHETSNSTNYRHRFVFETDIKFKQFLAPILPNIAFTIVIMKEIELELVKELGGCV